MRQRRLNTALQGLALRSAATVALASHSPPACSCVRGAFGVAGAATKAPSRVTTYPEAMGTVSHGPSSNPKSPQHL